MPSSPRLLGGGLVAAVLLGLPAQATGVATVAWTSLRDGDREIYVAPADGTGTPLNISNDGAADQVPSLARDGALVAWRSFRDGNNEIYVAPPDGSGTPVNVSNAPLQDTDPSISDSPPPPPPPPAPAPGAAPAGVITGAPSRRSTSSTAPQSSTNRVTSRRGIGTAVAVMLPPAADTSRPPCGAVRAGAARRRARGPA